MIYFRLSFPIYKKKDLSSIIKTIQKKNVIMIGSDSILARKKNENILRFTNFKHH